MLSRNQWEWRIASSKETTSTSVIFDFADLKPGTQYQIVTFVQNAVGASDSLEVAFKTNAVEPNAGTFGSGLEEYAEPGVELDSTT